MTEKHICKICGAKFDKLKNLSAHIQRAHNLSSKEYTKRYLCKSDDDWKCKECEAETRYVSFGFKDYCKEHSKLAMKKGGAKGGKAPSWNKGRTKEDDPRIMEYSINFSGEGNPFFGKSHKKETIEKLSKGSILSKEAFSKRIESRNKEFSCLTSYEEYSSRQKTYLKFKCNTCNSISEKTLQAFERGSLCTYCFPFTSSKEENEIVTFLKEDLKIKNIIQNSRKIIPPKEIDIYLPDFNLAIEYNGLYWHSNRKEDYNKKLHYEKFVECKNKEIKLINIFSDEWLNKKDLIKSMLKSRLGLCETVFARDCSIKEIDSKTGKLFFDENHISKNTLAAVYFGLFDKEENLLSCISLRNPHHKSYKNSIEIARFATVKNVNVVGGFGKLIKQVIAWGKDKKYESIISYCDLRFGEGVVYTKCNFEKIKENTGLNFWYTDGKERFNRFKFRAQKGYSEKEWASLNEVYRVYGCGNSLFCLELYN